MGEVEQAVDIDAQHDNITSQAGAGGRLEAGQIFVLVLLRVEAVLEGIEVAGLSALE